MPTHIRITPAVERDRKRERHSEELPGWAKHREPLIEKPISSLTAHAEADKWAQRAKEHSFGANAARSPDEITQMAKRRARIKPR